MYIKTKFKKGLIKKHVPLRATKISFFQPYFSCTPDSTTNKAFSRHSVSKAEQKSKYSCSTKATARQKQGRFWYAIHPHLACFCTLICNYLEQASKKRNVITYMYLSSLVSGRYLKTIYF